MQTYIYPPNAVSVSFPSGASTAAKQDEQTALLTDIETNTNSTLAKLPATIGQLASNASFAVVLSSNQETIISAIRTAVEASATAASQATIISALGNLLTELQLKVDLSETQPVSAASLPLPTGAATSANQSSIITALANLLTELQLKADLSETQPVSAASLPLPTGAATATKQDSQIAELQDIEADVEAMSAKLPATLGQKAMSASLSVAIASDQSAVPVAQAALAASFQEITNLTNSAQTFTAPAGARWAKIHADSGNAATIRYKMGGTATTTSGLQLEQGRSEDLYAVGNISVICETADTNQKVYVQFGA